MLYGALFWVPFYFSLVLNFQAFFSNMVRRKVKKVLRTCSLTVLTRCIVPFNCSAHKQGKPFKMQLNSQNESSNRTWQLVFNFNWLSPNCNLPLIQHHNECLRFLRSGSFFVLIYMKVSTNFIFNLNKLVMILLKSPVMSLLSFKYIFKG